MDTGSLGIITKDMVPRPVNFFFLEAGVPAERPDTVLTTTLVVQDTDRVFAVVLPETWHPSWWKIPGRNAFTEHNPNISYRKVLLTWNNTQQIAWLSNRTLMAFCWDEVEQAEWLARLAPTN